MATILSAACLLSVALASYSATIDVLSVPHLGEKVVDWRLRKVVLAADFRRHRHWGCLDDDYFGQLS